VLVAVLKLRLQLPDPLLPVDILGLAEVRPAKRLPFGGAAWCILSFSPSLWLSASPFGGRWCRENHRTAFKPLLTSFYNPMVLYNARAVDRRMVP